jgi:hypothetical protein
MLKTILHQVSIVGCLTILCLADTAFANYPLSTDDTGTQGRLKFQLDTSAEFSWDRATGNAVTTKTAGQSFNLGITAGVLDPLDLVLSLPFSWQQVRENNRTVYDQGGLHDLSLALKWRFVELGPASLAIKPAVTFPSGDHDRGLGAARPAYGATLISTVEVKPVAVHANIGYTYQNYTDADKAANREQLWNLSVAGTVEVTKQLLVVAEVGAATNANRACATWPLFVTGGLTYSVLDNLDLELGVKGGLNEPATDITILTGVTLRLP